MYLSQLLVNPRSRNARIDLSDRYEMHRTLLSAFPEDLPDEERVLYRVEDQRNLPVVTIIVQSHLLPDWELVERMQQRGYLAHTPQMRTVAPEVAQDQRLPFRLQANPTVKREGKRHAIYGDEDLIRWLQRKGEQHGFSCEALDVQVAKLGNKRGKRRLQTWHAVQFDGVLTVTQPMLFSGALMQGVGSGKAFGFGLLSIPYRTAG